MPLSQWYIFQIHMHQLYGHRKRDIWPREIAMVPESFLLLLLLSSYVTNFICYEQYKFYIYFLGRWWSHWPFITYRKSRKDWVVVVISIGDRTLHILSTKIGRIWWSQHCKLYESWAHIKPILFIEFVIFFFLYLIVNGERIGLEQYLEHYHIIHQQYLPRAWSNSTRLAGGD